MCEGHNNDTKLADHKMLKSQMMKLYCTCQQCEFTGKETQQLLVVMCSSTVRHSSSLLSSLYPMHFSTFCLSLLWSPSSDVLSQLPTLQRNMKAESKIFIHQLMHVIVLNCNIKICIKIAPTRFGAVTPSSGSALFVLAEVTLVKIANYGTLVGD
jgi:hypothetical protein